MRDGILVAHLSRQFISSEFGTNGTKRSERRARSAKLFARLVTIPRHGRRQPVEESGGWSPPFALSARAYSRSALAPFLLQVGPVHT